MADPRPEEAPLGRTPPSHWNPALQPERAGAGMTPTGSGPVDGPSSQPVASFARPECLDLSLVSYLRADNLVHFPEPLVHGLFRPPRIRVD
jgi:hypothetical protein